MCSTWVVEAASISSTSGWVPASIWAQLEQALQAVPSGLGLGQLKALARIRARVVLPTPRVPVNM